MPWRVEVLNQAVLKELDSLPRDMRAKLDHIVHLIEELGLHQVREPAIKPLQDKLWEMRVKVRDGIARAIYVTVRRVAGSSSCMRSARRHGRPPRPLSERLCRE